MEFIKCDKVVFKDGHEEPIKWYVELNNLYDEIVFQTVKGTYKYSTRIDPYDEIHSDINANDRLYEFRIVPRSPFYKLFRGDWLSIDTIDRIEIRRF